RTPNGARWASWRSPSSDLADRGEERFDVGRGRVGREAHPDSAVPQMRPCRRLVSIERSRGDGDIPLSQETRDLADGPALDGKQLRRGGVRGRADRAGAGDLFEARNNLARDRLLVSARRRVEVFQPFPP